MTEETFAILGAGKTGTGIGTVLQQSGKRVVAVADCDRAAAERAAQMIGCPAFASLPDAAHSASRVLITTSDDAIEPVCRMLAEAGSFHAGMIVIHMSGAGGLSLLSSAAAAGAETACIHPIQSFSSADSAAARIPGSTFGVTTTKELESWAFELVRAIGGKPFTVAEKDRPLYHAAACIASNYLVTLMYLSQQLYMTLGLSADEARRTFWPLVQGTITNIEQKGIPDALTGPVSRGDRGTILKHLEAMQSGMPAALPFYRLLGMLTADLATLKGSLSEAQAADIKTILGGDDHE